MVFQERVNGNGFLYDVEDVFGKIRIESTAKLDADILDELVMVLLKQNSRAQTINGEVKHNDGIIKYTFEKTPVWGDDDRGKEPSKELEPALQRQTNLWQWIRKFHTTFKETWKQSDKY